jgi:hypothetical protein
LCVALPFLGAVHGNQGQLDVAAVLKQCAVTYAPPYSIGGCTGARYLTGDSCGLGCDLGFTNNGSSFPVIRCQKDGSFSQPLYVSKENARLLLVSVGNHQWHYMYAAPMNTNILTSIVAQCTASQICSSAFVLNVVAGLHVRHVLVRQQPLF